MAADSSFDVVSDFDQQELVNALDQARREIATRYDFKGSKVAFELAKDDARAARPMTSIAPARRRTCSSRRPCGAACQLKIFDWGKIEPAGGGTVRQEIKLTRGLTSEQAKELSKRIREALPEDEAGHPGRRGARLGQVEGRAAGGDRRPARRSTTRSPSSSRTTARPMPTRPRPPTDDELDAAARRLGRALVEARLADGERRVVHRRPGRARRSPRCHARATTTSAASSATRTRSRRSSSTCRATSSTTSARSRPRLPRR